LGSDLPKQQEKPVPVDAATLSLLACPVCHGGLSVAGGRMVCAECKRSYPVRDGIPALIAERAQP
jgi:uncharacterized protein YbaR (Trm112 family)